MKKNYLIVSFSAISLALIDYISKEMAKNSLSSGDIDLIWGIKFSLGFNEGIAFGIPITGLLQISLSFIFLGFLVYYSCKNWSYDRLTTKAAMCLILGGALGNLYERIFIGKVTDFISVFEWYPTFNLADAFIFVGVVLILFFEKRLTDYS